MDLTVRGGDQFAALARRLKRAKAAELEKEYQAGIRKAVAPLHEAVRTDIPKYMPSGYAPVLAADLRMRSRASGTAGVRITGSATGGRRVRALERGKLRHPVFGHVRFNRKLGRHTVNPWVNQRIRRGFFTEPLRRAAPTIRAALVDVLQGILRKIAKG